MIYTVEKAILISRQLRKFTDSYAHMVAGQYANIDFWMDEVISALKAIDEHNSRFEKMRDAQEDWIEEKNTRIPNYCHICEGVCEFDDKHNRKPELPKQRANNEKKRARKELVDSAYYFLTRCYRMGIISSKELKIKCDAIGTSIDPQHLEI